VQAADNPYGGVVNLTSRLLTLLSAEGRMVAAGHAGMDSLQFTWSATGERTPWPAPAARTELARRWLSRSAGLRR